MVLNPSAITKLFCDSPLFRDSKSFFDEFFLYASKSILGVAPESLDNLTKETIFNAICERFNGLTVQDIQFAFKTHQNVEKVYVLTRDEFIKPIQNYWNKKLIVQRELDAELKAIEQQQKNEAEKVAFVNKSMEMYHEHLRNGITEWSGTDFEALPAAMEFAQSVTHEKKKLLTLDAQREYKERVYRNEQDGNAFEIIPPVKYIYARMMLNYLLNREIGAHPAIVE